MTDLLIARPLLRPHAGCEPIDRAEVVLAIGVVSAIEPSEPDDRRQRGKAVHIGEGMVTSPLFFGPF